MMYDVYGEDVAMRLNRSLLLVMAALGLFLVVTPGCDDDGDWCQPGQGYCEDKCIDLRVDPEHCGRCWNPCGKGEVCVKGACTIKCPANQDRCGGGDAGAPTAPT